MATLGFLWTKESGRMHPLAPAGTDIISTALALNDSRQVVGVSVDENFNPKAVIWTAGMSTATDLNTLTQAVQACTLFLHAESTRMAKSLVWLWTPRESPMAT
jgi:hypothetical protein